MKFDLPTGLVAGAAVILGDFFLKNYEKQHPHLTAVLIGVFVMFALFVYFMILGRFLNKDG